MKVVAKKRYYEEDLYSIPGHGNPTKERLKDYADHIRKLCTIAHKKGGFDRWEVRAGEYCCSDLKDSGKAQVECYWEENPVEIGMFLPFQGYGETDFVHINYCPFCGEKIEVVEEE